MKNISPKVWVFGTVVTNLVLAGYAAYNGGGENWYLPALYLLLSFLFAQEKMKKAIYFGINLATNVVSGVLLFAPPVGDVQIEWYYPLLIGLLIYLFTDFD